MPSALEPLTSLELSRGFAARLEGADANLQRVEQMSVQSELGAVEGVAEIDGYVIGTAYSSRFRDKAAYRSSVETTVVVDPDHQGRGIGRLLLAAVLDAIASEGLHRAYAIVTIPNEASIGLHESLGYRLVGTLDEVGYKLGTYWATAILEKSIESDGS